jgi:hypothetical protein
VSLVDHIGAPLEGSSILDATLESPAHFVERMQTILFLIHIFLIFSCEQSTIAPGGKKQSSKFAVLPSGCLKLWVRVSLRCNGLHYM